MPWTARTFKDRHNKKLTLPEAASAAKQATSMIRSGAPEGVAIATANKRFKRFTQGGSVKKLYPGGKVNFGHPRAEDLHRIPPEELARRNALHPEFSRARPAPFVPNPAGTPSMEQQMAIDAATKGTAPLQGGIASVPYASGPMRLPPPGSPAGSAGIGAGGGVNPPYDPAKMSLDQLTAYDAQNPEFTAQNKPNYGGMKKGGSVKKFASGGKVSAPKKFSAGGKVSSHRGDGLAQRGKTKGRMV